MANEKNNQEYVLVPFEQFRDMVAMIDCLEARNPFPPSNCNHQHIKNIHDNLHKSSFKTVTDPKTLSTKCGKVDRKAIDWDIMLCDKKVFKDDDEHEYSFKCYDGYALGKPTAIETVQCSDLPKVLLVYPKADEIEYDKKLYNKVRDYIGVDESQDECLTFADIAITLGKIVKI